MKQSATFVCPITTFIYDVASKILSDRNWKLFHQWKTCEQTPLITVLQVTQTRVAVSKTQLPTPLHYDKV
jgi:hypothetical protein